MQMRWRLSFNDNHTMTRSTKDTESQQKPYNMQYGLYFRFNLSHCDISVRKNEILDNYFETGN